MINKITSTLVLASFLLSAAPSLALANTDESTEMKVRAKTVDTACVVTALDKRETALMSGQDTFHTAIINAYTARKAALKDAWAKPNGKERRIAVRAAWMNFSKASLTAQKNWRTTKNSAWKTFRTEAKACGASSALDLGSEGMDSGI